MIKIKNFLKNYWIFIFLATLVGSLLVLHFTLKAKPQPEAPIPTPKLGSISQPESKFTQQTGVGPFYEVSFSKDAFESLPKKLAVYKVKKLSKEECLSFLRKMTEELGFTNSPIEETRKDGLYLIWKKGNNYLDVNPQTCQFNFSGKITLIQLESTPFLIESKIRQKLIFWGFIPDSIGVGQINGFNVSGLELIPTTNLNKASVFQILYKPRFDDYSLVGIGSAQNLIESKIDKNGNLLSLQFSLHQPDRSSFDYYPTKSYDEAVSEIKEGKIQIIQVLTADGQQRSTPELNEIQVVKISELSLAYYETEEVQEFYQPIFLLEGEIILKDQNKYQSSFILPAVSSRWLSSPLPKQEYFQP